MLTRRGRTRAGRVAGSAVLVAALVGGCSADAGPREQQPAVLVGAAVPPVLPVDGPQAEAFRDFDQALDARLGIAHVFRAPGEPLVPPGLDELATDGRQVMLSWNLTDLPGVAAGAHDEELRAQARALAATGHRPLLRVRWEMDRPNLRATVVSPEVFVAAWRRVHDLFAEVGAAAGWVWCPTAQGFDEGGDAPAFFPGEQYVDWLCADAYPDRSLAPLSRLLEPFLAWAARHDRPVMIGEVGVPRSADDAARAAWVAEALAWLDEDRDVDAVVWFALDVDPTERVLQFGVDRRSQTATALGLLARTLQEQP